MGRRPPRGRSSAVSQPRWLLTLPLPGEVQNIAGNGNRCSNLGLWLDRFLLWQRDASGSRWELPKEVKERAQFFRIAQQRRQEIEGLLKALRERYDGLLAWYKRQGFTVCRFQAKPVWRFVVGLGAAHVLETGITLHRLFGLPLIPASGLKGAARAFALKMEGKREDDPDFIAVFGTTDRAGSVIFLDAIPAHLPRFKLDIMNPHYPNYYRTQGEKPPADYESPTPVFFLTVEGTPYHFALATRAEDAEALLNKAEQWLKGALQELGIGAKTSADYGYWEVT